MGMGDEMSKRLPFWERVAKGAPHECWPWQGYVRDSGHGLTSLDSLPIHASRKAYILTYGPIRGEQCVLHKAKEVCPMQAICCNPEHMYLGTRADNMVDRWTNTSGDARGSLGRPHSLTEEQMTRLWQMRLEGATLKQCGREFGVHIATVMRYITNIRKQHLQKNRADRLAALRE